MGSSYNAVRKASICNKIGLTPYFDLSQSGFTADQLRDANLAGATLQQCGIMGSVLGTLNLQDANLSCSNLSHSDLGNNLFLPSSTSVRTARYCNANLSKSLLDCTSLQNADLRGANLSGTTLYRTNFHGADLSGADFTGAKINDIILTRVDLTGAIGLETCQHFGPSTLDALTLMMSGELPNEFLLGAGLLDSFIDYLPSMLNSAIEYYSCFISYSHADKSFAIQLHDSLQGKGIRCWLDEKQMLPGDDIYEQIDHGIRLWDKVLLCCSESSLTSWWVDNEIDIAFGKEQELMKERKEKVLSLIPLNLDNYLLDGKWRSGKSVPVTSRVAADFTGWETNQEKFESAFNLVVKALHANNTARELPPIPKL